MLRSTFLTVALLPCLAIAETGLPRAPVASDFPEVDAGWVAIGRHLFFDPILAGNNNIACATCHHPSLGTGDAVSLSLGEGATGLGEDRVADAGNLPRQRIPRNAPALWNLGAAEFVTMFHDGRVQTDPDAMYGIRMPEGRTLERPVASALAAQNILPLLSSDEMAGHPGENAIADAVADDRIRGPGGAWDIIALEVASVPDYAERFAWLTDREDVHITDIAKALSSFIAFEFRATDSPFDRYLRGQHDAITDRQMAGMELFYGKAGCSNCHAGPFQTDHAFHAIGLPQFGPGKEAGAYGYADIGRGAVTGAAEDDYRFRTPSLRNVTLTAPYGHNGAYTSLEAMVRHHLDPIRALTGYDRGEARLHALPAAGDDWRPLEDSAEVLSIATSVEIAPVNLSDAEIDALLAFLEALTDPNALTGRLGVPEAVPSGLPLDPL